MGKEEKETFEEVIEFLETHDGKLMRGNIGREGKILTRGEMTEEQKEEINLYNRWINSKERKILEEYAGKPIEEVPEEYRDKIARLRSYGLGINKKKEKKTTFEEVIKFLETHDGKLMRGSICQEGKILTKEGMTKEQIEEVNLYGRWKRTEEKRILEEYAGQPIENVPEEYRDKIARLREFGLGMKKSKLSQAKHQRDEAKYKNEQAKELEKQVAEQLKKRGKNHEKQ